MKVKVIVNPAVGEGKRRDVWRRIKIEFERKNWQELQLVYFVSQSPDHTRQLAYKAGRENFDMILAVVGDGTAGEAAAGCLENDMPLAVVPAGTGNAFAASVCQTKSTQSLFKALLDPRIIQIDVGMMNEKIFLNMAGVGLDALLVNQYQKSILGRGILGYMFLGLKAAVNFEPFLLEIKTDHEKIQCGATMVAICNGSFYGGGLKMASGAVLNDGQLDICLMEGLTLQETAVLWRSLYHGNHVKHPKVRLLRSSTLHIKTDPAFYVHRDGDAVGLTPCSVKVLPKALSLIKM